MGNRYDQLLTLIDLITPKTIIEVGTWNGENAIRMINAARKHTHDVTYIGYDLFELATAETDKEEFNVKPHNKIKDVQRKLEENCAGAVITLIGGNTRESLRNKIRGDLVFVDGGHSLETIKNDYEAVSDSSVIVLDDYYSPDSAGSISDTALYGCNALISTMDHAIILPKKDKVSGGGLVQFAMVLNK